VWTYGRGQTDTDTQTCVTTIHFASSTTRAKCKYSLSYENRPLNATWIAVIDVYGYSLNIVSCIQLPNIASLQCDKFSHKGVYLSHLIAEVDMSTGT